MEDGGGGEHLVFQLNDTLHNYGDRIQARCPSNVAQKQKAASLQIAFMHLATEPEHTGSQRQAALPTVASNCTQV